MKSYKITISFPSPIPNLKGVMIQGIMTIAAEDIARARQQIEQKFQKDQVTYGGASILKIEEAEELN